MSLLSAQDLFVVYKPEKGVPTSLAVDGIDYSALDRTTGEVYGLECVAQNIVSVDGDETSQLSNGDGLLVSIRVRLGSVTDVFVDYGGENYAQNEVFTISNSGAKIILTNVGEGGTVNDVDLYLDEAGTGITITDGLLTDFPYGYHADMAEYQPATTGSFVDFQVSGGTVKAAVIGLQKFEPIVTSDGTSFTVGEEVHVLSSRFSDGAHISTNVLSVTDVVSGGICKFNRDQLKADVQEWANEVDINLSVEVVDNDGTAPAGGDLSYDISTGKLRYTKSDIDISSEEGSITLEADYGFIVDQSGDPSEYTITTQRQLNEQLMLRIKNLEETIYRTFPSGRIGFDSPQLKDGTLAKDENGENYSEVATRNDLMASSNTQAISALQQLEDLVENIYTSADFDALKATYTPEVDTDD